MSRRQRQANLTTLFCGLAVTVLVVIFYLAGWLNWIELKTLDLRFLYASTTPQDERITCIDIDDGSIDIIGRWPWPRDVQAGLIAILSELKPAALLMDITLGEPETLRTIVPRYADIALDPLTLGAEAVTIAFPDLEIKVAIEAAGMVYLAFDYAPYSTQPRIALEDAIYTWLNEQPERWRQPVHMLFAEFCSFAELTLDINVNRQHEEIVYALREVLGHQATIEPELLLAERVAAAAQRVGRIAPVYFLHARAARRCGFVVFEPDIDGVMRRMRLLVEHEGHVLPQLAFALACDALGLQAEDISATRGSLVLRVPGRDRPIVVQLDGDGRTLVPWVPQRVWTQQFGSHIPMDAIWQVYDRRQAIRHNRELVLKRLGELLEAGLLADQQQNFDDLMQVSRLESELRRARYVADTDAVEDMESWLAQYREVLPAGMAALRAAAGELAVRLEAESGEDVARVDASVPREIERALAANDEYLAEIEATLDRLRPRVAGKLCVVGYTATSLADMTPIATNKRAPGVVAHANLLNGLLTGRMAYWAPLWLNGLITLLLGSLAAVVSTRWGPWISGAILAVVATAFVALAGGLAFALWTYWFALTPALLALAAAYFVVLLYRYIFLERESRQIATALSQYTSATLAKQMAEDAELCKRAEMREVTAVFTDLARFTTISERIGAERTQHVLNVTLGRFSDVMLRYEGMINKFIGDGIFAFWNPVIYPQLDHARRACETAIDLQVALHELVREQQGSGGDEAFNELVLRVGVATGKAIVGPCGSERKFDYTCIGDSVNVAARLESANKFYGTLTLISETTLVQAGDGFATRPLGSVQVKGKTQGVPIYELLGREPDVSDEDRDYAAHFGQAVNAFQQREWSQALRAFEACMHTRPDDRAAQQYVVAVRQYLATPPAEGWNGALELMEK
ncbi:MAG: CHASE2 domain-containing protein [Planctomycetota bacterium]